MENRSGSSIVFIRASNLGVPDKPHAWHPPTDLFETEQGYIIRIEIAGMRAEDFSIQFDNDILVISGRRLQLNEKCAYHRMEIPTGEFISSVQMPENINITLATAEYDLGFLTIQIPKSMPVHVKINPAGVE